MQMTGIRIDLSSDTSTRPSAGMREAMARAEVGDEQKGEDPTTNALCERVAGMLGKEAAMLLPSGIMSNVVAILTHCRSGDDIICDSHAHIIGSEGGAPAALGGVSITPIPTSLGIYSAAELEAAIRPARSRSPRSRLAHIEQTTNRGGGVIWPLTTVTEVAEMARSHGLSVHMDGARLLNAAAASNVPASDFAAPCDSVWIDLSKGLGAPIGSVLTGSRDFIEQAWDWKHRLGGAMRQSGVIAAAGLYALDHHLDQLVTDHANAQSFARQIAGIPGVRLDPPDVMTNLVFFDVGETGLSAPEVAKRLLAQGIRVGAQNQRRIRAVTHLDVSEDDITTAAEAIRDIVTDGD